MILRNGCNSLGAKVSCAPVNGLMRKLDTLDREDYVEADERVP